MIWFHHIKSVEKRKEIVRLARAGNLRGFCKPGFPGVVVCEGAEMECASFVTSLRGLRWEAMDVRYEESTTTSSRMPLPFVELRESGMGEAAALCSEAGLLDAFRASVLKLKPRDAMELSPAEALPRLELPDPRWIEPPSAMASGEAARHGDRGTLDADAIDTTQELVLHMEHMNDRTGYLRILSRWATKMQLGVRVFFAVGGGRQARAIVTVVHGPREGCRTFLQQLRTQNVDVDVHGRACKERLCTVLYQERLRTERQRLCGWLATQYDSEAELRAALETIGIQQPVVLSRRSTDDCSASVDAASEGPNQPARQKRQSGRRHK